MKTFNKEMLVCMLVLVFSLSLLSAMPNAAKAQPLAQAVETQTVGGISDCARAWGLGLGLAAASLSGCWVVCAVLAWYDLALIAAAC